MVKSDGPYHSSINKTILTFDLNDFIGRVRSTHNTGKAYDNGSDVLAIPNKTKGDPKPSSMVYHLH